MAAPSASVWFFFTFWPRAMIGFWFRHVRSFSPWNFRMTYSRTILSFSSILIRSLSAYTTTPSSCAFTSIPLCRATSRSSPVATMGGSVTSRGTACRCMFETP